MKACFRTSLAAALMLLPLAGFAQDEAPTALFYKQTCAMCHGDKGQGMPGLAPALKGNKFVTAGNVKELEATITKGRVGDQKRYKDFPSPMPPAAVEGEKLQALIGYLRGDLQR